VWTQSRPITAPANLKFTYTVSNTGLSGSTTDKLTESLSYLHSVSLYDALGRVRQTQAPTPQGGRLVTESFFDSRGLVRKKNNGYWDPATQPALALASAADNTVPSQDVTTYDGLGRAIKVDWSKNAVVQETTITVYGGDRTTVIPPTGGTVKTTVTDPLGRTVELDDYTVRPTVTPPADTFIGNYQLSGGTSQAITYGFDGHGSQSTVTANGSTWTRTYGLLGQVTAKSDPDAGSSTMVYDAVGNLTQSTDSRGKNVSYTYDSLNRKTGSYTATVAAQAPANQIAAWVYDNDNNAVVGMTDPIGHVTTSTSYTAGSAAGSPAYVTQSAGFNVFGESLGETVTIPSAAEGTTLGKSYAFTHTYTANSGLPYTDIYPSGSGMPSETAMHTYTPNFDLPAGLATASYTYTQDTSYDAYGRVSQSQIGSTTSYGIITNTYDPHTGSLTDQLVQKATTGAPTDVDRQHYDYDQAGNTTRQVSTRLGATSETQCFGYDELDRLKQAWTATDSCAAAPTGAAHAQVGDAITGGAYWTDWSFDALGNRASQVEHSTTGGADTTTTYTYNGNGKNQPHTLTAATGGTTLQYDTTGNTTGRTTTASGNQTLTWDDAGRLNKITGGTAGTSSYVYDADGNVLLQKDPGTTTLYLPGQQIALNTTTGTATSTRYLPLPGGGTVVRTGSATNYRFEIADPHGTSGLVLDNTCQTPTWRQFTPYGAPRGTTVTWPDNRGFLNAPTSGATGLTILGARQYDPTTGRFISPDPLLETTDAQQLGGYNYAADNPILKSDPTGNMAWDPDTGIAAGTPKQLQESIVRAYKHGFKPGPAYVRPEPRRGNYHLGGFAGKIRADIPDDDFFPYDPNAKPTAGDYASWFKWTGEGEGAWTCSVIQACDLMDASATYMHYVNNGGEDYEVNFANGVKQDSSIREFSARQIGEAAEWASYYASITGKTSFQINGDPQDAYGNCSYPATENWQKTVGDYHSWVTADVTVDGGAVKMRATVHMQDRYNFNKDAKDIRSGQPDNENGRFSTLGWARPFTTYGSWTTSVSWSYAP
jgi:RHS repeat-associated protein